MAVNKRWHDKHRVPPNATIEKRIQWHTKGRETMRLAADTRRCARCDEEARDAITY
jgi:hypothetical protein